MNMTAAFPRTEEAIREVLTAGQLSFDARDWFACHLDTPISNPGGTASLKLQPGTAVQTKTFATAVFGRVHLNDATECCVIGHGWDESPAEVFVWRGTRAEFTALWKVD